MDAILASLGELVLRAVPTLLLVVFLHFYLKYVFFAPLDKVLEARSQATGGARAAAQASLETASRKAAEYEAAIRAARSEVYKEQEESRGVLRQRQAAALDESRRNASEMVKQARVQLADEVTGAKRVLAGESDRLASAIVESILRGDRV
jgi:F-type H+-transporting ATPase subunit b